MRCVLVGLAVVVMASCGITVDLSDMQYVNPDVGSAPPGDTGADAGATEGVGEVLPDAVLPDVVVPPDAGGGDTGQKEIDCWKVVRCVWDGEKSCNSFVKASGCMTKCAGTDTWDDDPDTAAFQECVESKCGSTSGYTLPDEMNLCVQEKCLETFINCVESPSGYEMCSAGFDCVNLYGCFPKGEGKKPDMHCFGDCASTVDPVGFAIIRKLFQVCPGTEGAAPEQQAACMEGIYECYAGSGKDNCAQIWACNDKCGAIKNDDKERQDCSALCLGKMSQEGAELFWKSTRCAYEPMTNPFECLDTLAKCLETYQPEDMVLLQCMTNVLSPIGIATIWRSMYYKEFQDKMLDWLDSIELSPADIGWQLQFGIMAGALSKTDKDEWDSVGKLIGCLRDKQDNVPLPPGASNVYGLVPKAGWDGCEAEAKCFH
jgi:hypothetical protein